MKKKFKLNRGYTLLFSVLTAVMVLSIAVFILGVARKQYILSSTANDSLVALYNADSGVECIVQSGVGESTYNSGDSIQLTCNGTVVSGTFANSDVNIEKIPTSLNPSGLVQVPAPNANPQYLYLKLRDPISTTVSRGCALVKIWQGNLVSNPSSRRTIVYSRGYNQCDDTNKVPLNSQRTVERAMQFTAQ